MNDHDDRNNKRQECKIIKSFKLLFKLAEEFSKHINDIIILFAYTDTDVCFDNVGNAISRIPMGRSESEDGNPREESGV